MLATENNRQKYSANSAKTRATNLGTLIKEEVLCALEIVAPVQHAPPRCDDRAARLVGQVPAAIRGHLANDVGAQASGVGTGAAARRWMTK